MFDYILEQIVMLWEKNPDSLYLKLSKDKKIPKLIMEWEKDGIEYNKAYLIERSDGERLIAKLKRACTALEKTSFLN